MNIIDRARFLMFGDAPRRKARASITDPLTRLLILGLGKQAIWSKQDFKTLAEEGYEKCMAVYACVNLVAKTAAGIEFKAKRGKADADDHPVLKLLGRPNAYEGKRAWIHKRFSQLLLAGNSYCQAIRPVSTMPPAALYLPRPDRMRVLPGTSGELVGGYEYEVNGQKTTLAAELILHSKMFHPTDDFYGLSPLQVAARGVDISNMAAEWNMRLLQNDMRPPGVLSTEGGLSETQYQRLKAEVKQEYQGFENAGTPLLLEGGLTWQNISITPKDLDWLNATIHNKREIAAVFNVAPELIGDSQNKTYSNFQEARRALYTEAVLPLMAEMVDDLNTWLCPMFEANLTLEIAKEKIEALQEDREKKFTYINNAKFMTINEKRAEVGLDPVQGPNGDMILVSYSDMPLDLVATEQAPSEEKPEPGKKPKDEDEDDEKGKKSILVKVTPWATIERKEALWNNFVRRLEMKERSALPLALRFLKDQAKRAAATKDLDIAAEAESFRKLMRPWAIQAARRAGNAGIRAAKGEMPELEEKVDLFHLTEAQAKELDALILRSGTKISETTMEFVRDMLKIAEAGDWTTEELTQGLITKLDTFAQWRCRTIARTETAKVENWGQLEGYKETEYVTRKGWMCSFVPESRDAHIEADGQEVGINEDFIVGGQAMAYPGDPRGDAANVINCLCSHYPIVD